MSVCMYDFAWSKFFIEFFFALSMHEALTRQKRGGIIATGMINKNDELNNIKSKKRTREREKNL